MNSWTQNPKSNLDGSETPISTVLWRGVRIHSFDYSTIPTWLDVLLARPGVARVATVNAEFIVRASRSRNFLRSLRSATVCVADGVGIRLLYLLSSDPWQGRVTGRAIAAELLSRSLPICILVPTDGLQSAGDLESRLRALYPAARIQVSAWGTRSRGSTGVLNVDDQVVLYRLTANARVVLATHGAPTQEYLAQALQARTDGVAQLVVGIGGALDVLSGALPTPPAVFTALGLEWLYRLIQQPRRLPRIYQSVVVYPWVVLVGWMGSREGSETEE